MWLGWVGGCDGRKDVESVRVSFGGTSMHVSPSPTTTHAPLRQAFSKSYAGLASLAVVPVSAVAAAASRAASAARWTKACVCVYGWVWGSDTDGVRRRRTTATRPTHQLANGGRRHPFTYVRTVGEAQRRGGAVPRAAAAAACCPRPCPCCCPCCLIARIAHRNLQLAGSTPPACVGLWVVGLCVGVS